MKRKTTFLIGAAVIALVFVVYVALEGLPPSDDNVADDGCAASSTYIHLQLLHADDVLYERSLATRAR